MLHFIRNPEAEYYRLERDMRVEQLEAENGALRDNIASLEAQAAQGGCLACHLLPGDMHACWPCCACCGLWLVHCQAEAGACWW